MPQPLPDLTRDQQCHHYQAPTGQRCGSPALKNEYYCYHHHIKQANRTNRRILIDPEITRMELPPVEDRASIFVALAAIVHRLAENTIDTRRAGQLIYALQVALQALQPAPAAPAAQPQPPSAPGPPPAAAPSNKRCHPERSAQRAVEGPRGTTPATSADTIPPPDPPAPTTIPITKDSLLYFLRSRHCVNCNAELFPASALAERSHPGATPTLIEESRPALPVSAASESALTRYSGSCGPDCDPRDPRPTAP